MIPILSKAQIYLADNGLTLSGTGVNRKVQLGGSLLINTSFDLGATFTYNIRKGTANYLHILNNGNIGFGTNAPTASFDVLGASRFRNSLTLNYGTANRTTQIRDNGLYISRTTDGTYTNAITADASMSLVTRGDFKFVNNAIERVTFLETGNVGIGNTNPSYKLDVSGTFRGTNLVSQVPVGNVTSLKLLNQDGTMLGSFETDAGASTYLRSFFNLTIDPNTSGTGGSYVKITTLSGAGTRMVVADHNGILSTQAIPLGGGGGYWNQTGNNITNLNDGYVGIGTLNPMRKLHVVGSGMFEPTDADGFTTIHAKGAVNWNKGLEYKITDADGVSNAYGLKISGYNVSGNKTVRFALEGANEGSFTGENWNFERSVMFRGGISNGNHEDFVIRLKTNTLSPGNKAIKFYAENFGANPIMSIVQNGTVGIGTSDTKGFKFAVAGNMIAEKLVVKLASAWPDYVFEPNYKLPTLSYVEKYIREHGHLPGVTSAKEIEEKGIDVAETQAQLLKKIEELTLYVIELKKEIDSLKIDKSIQPKKK
jgi:hypothetical protein